MVQERVRLIFADNVGYPKLNSGKITINTGGDRMDWIAGMQNAIDYIEELITERVDYVEIA